jgi:hypothetical protein
MEWSVGDLTINSVDSLLNKYKHFISSFIDYMYIDYLELGIIVLLAASFWFTIVTTRFRQKLCFFLLFFLVLCLWGFWASFDGLILLMLLSELVVILIFLLNFLSGKWDFSSRTYFKGWFVCYWLSLGVVLICALPNFTSKQFTMYDFLYLYSLDIIGSDLFLIFYLYFVQVSILTIFVGMFLSFVSIIFSLLFFSFRFYKVFNKNRLKHKIIIRRQHLMKQGRYKIQMRLFQ